MKSNPCGNTVENCQGLAFKLLLCVLQLDVHFIEHACLYLNHKINVYCSLRIKTHDSESRGQEEPATTE